MTCFYQSCINLYLIENGDKSSQKRHVFMSLFVLFTQNVSVFLTEMSSTGKLDVLVVCTNEISSEQAYISSKLHLPDLKKKPFGY